MQLFRKELEATPHGVTPDDMRRMIKDREDRWAPVIKSANITID
jgi:tripartite-type tricarboxylate transporter receptor subunit TctC